MTTVRVCRKWFPHENISKEGFSMEVALKNNLDILLMNFEDDWDFTIVISGGGEVRLGKSVLAMQIACYIAYVMREDYNKDTMFDLNKNFVLRGEDLVKRGHFLGKNHPFSPLVFDEAGADLEGRKVMHSSTKKVLDYYRECGQYNLFNILVMPEYFDLPKGLALSRSIFLLNVWYSHSKEGKFIRGYFDFFSRPKKKKLYLKGKRDLNYHAATRDFHGRFYNTYTVDEQEYRRMKREALLNRKEDDEQRYDKKQIRGDTALYLLYKVVGWNHQKICDEFAKVGGKLPESTLSECINRVFPKEMR